MIPAFTLQEKEILCWAAEVVGGERQGAPAPVLNKDEKF